MSEQAPISKDRGQPSLAWLAAGAAIGLVLAAYGLLDRAAEPTALPDDTIARVNDELIDRRRYERSIEAMRSGRDTPPAAEDRQRVLQQIIDEELLVQRGIELDMMTTEATVRAAIVESMVASVTADADAANPGDEELERFLEANADNYTYASAVDLNAWVTDDERLAQSFVETIRGAADASVPEALRAVPGLPSGPLPVARLRMFVGPAIAAATLSMPAGSSAVYARQGRWYVVRVNSHAESVRAELDAVRSQVLIDYRRDLANKRLAEYLRVLRQEADIALAAPP